MNNNRGFSLLELLIVSAISGVVMAAIVSVYSAQQRAHRTQKIVVDMQQNIRAAVYLMEREIRMAGYDRTSNADASIDTAGPGVIAFTTDTSEDGDTDDSNEDISYGFSTANDAGRDGLADNGAASLGRNTGGGFQPMAENIHAVAFAYAYDADDDDSLDSSGGATIWAIDSDDDKALDRNLDTDSDGDIDINDAAGGAALPATVNIDNIRAVKIWILARTGRIVDNYTDATTYVVGDKRVTVNDGYQRRLLTTTVKCRNMGLETGT